MTNFHMKIFNEAEKLSLPCTSFYVKNFLERNPKLSNITDGFEIISSQMNV
jgi:hypothetical protein